MMEHWEDVTNELRQEPESFPVTLNSARLPDGRMFAAGYLSVALGGNLLDAIGVRLDDEKFVCTREAIEKWLADRNVADYKAELALRLDPPEEDVRKGPRGALLQGQDVATVYELLDIVARKRGLSQDKGLCERLELLRRKLDAFSKREGDEDAYIAAAEEQHARDGVLDIDADALVSVGDYGAWVSAWVFVKRPRKKRRPKP